MPTSAGPERCGRAGRTGLVLAAVLAAVLAETAPAAAQPPPGAVACSGCHSPAGDPADGMPSLVGRPAGEIVEAMLAFRAGEGEPTVMDRIARGFTEEEIRAIAAWIASRR